MTDRASRHISRGKRIIFILLLAAFAFWLWQQAATPRLARNSVTPACSPLTFEGSHFTLCRFDPARHELALKFDQADGAPLRLFSSLADALGSDARRIAFATNGGMFNLGSQPVGLYVENGRERHRLNRAKGPGNFHLLPNGVFWTDDKGPHVTETEAYADLPDKRALFATQSGPMLVIDGKLHPQFSADGTSRHYRNGVGVTQGGQAQFVISEDKVSFGKFARLFRDKLACPNALFLDGFVSSLWDGATGRVTQRAPLGPMIVVLEKGRG